MESQKKIGELMDVLKAGALDAKIQVCAELGKIGFEARGARDDLIAAARGDASPRVRQAAIDAIGKIDAATRKKGVPIPKPFTPPARRPSTEQPPETKTKPPAKEPPAEKQPPRNPLVCRQSWKLRIQREGGAPAEPIRNLASPRTDHLRGSPFQ